jgi:protein SCO1/2
VKALLLALLILSASTAGARDSDSSDSLYRLDAALTNQDGREHALDVYRDHRVLVTMFYGSCQATCPLIIETLRSAENAVPPAQRAKLRVLMISFDPARDTVPALQSLAKTRRIDTTRWTLARADERTVRNLAALLNVQYRELPGGEFSHSTVIALLSPTGEVEVSTSKLGTADPALVERLRR